MLKKKSVKRLPQVVQLTEMVASKHPDAILLLLEEALQASGGKSEWGTEIQYALKDNQDLLNLIHSLQPRDMAEMILICQFVVLNSKGMQKLYDNKDDIGMNYIKLSQETFALLCRYRGKSAQNINVTYNVLNSGNAFLKTNLVQGVTEKKGETQDRS